MTTRDDLDSSGLRIERMWRAGAPRRVAAMEAAGTFYAFICALQNQEERLYGSLIERGVRPDQAREMMLEASAPPLSDQP